MNDLRTDAILQLLRIALSAIDVAVLAIRDAIDVMRLTEHKPTVLVEEEE